MRPSQLSYVILHCSTALVLSMGLPAIAAPNAAESAHLTKVERSNAAFHGWIESLSQFWNSYLPKRGLKDGPNEDSDIYIEAKKSSYSPVKKTLEEIKRTDQTQELFEHYYGHQGPAKRRGIFIESTRTWNGDGEWNELRWAGLEIKANRDKFLDACAKLGIYQIRFGIGIEAINPNRTDSVDSLLDFHMEAWKRGIALTDAILFFSNLREFEVLNADKSINFDKSYYSNKNIRPVVSARTKFYLTKLFDQEVKFNAANALASADQRKPSARTAINILNEPDTALGFLLQFWNKTKGLWSDPSYMRWYPQQVIDAASLTVDLRTVVEEAKQASVAKMGTHNPIDEKVLYFHNEAMTPERYPTHQGDLRFAISQLILGDDQLLNADFDKLATQPLEHIKARFEKNKKNGILNPVEAMILKYSFADVHVKNNESEAARTFIVAKMKQLKKDHLRFQKKFDKTAKTDTMAMFDYYQQSEFILKQTVPEMIKSLSENDGALLKKSIGTQTEEGFLNVLRERTQQAEAMTGQKIWPTAGAIDLEKLLAAEDGAVLDKLIGLRNDYGLDTAEELVARRNRAGFDAKVINGPGNDEHRIDTFFNDLQADDNALLKKALGVNTEHQLVQILNQIGADTSKGGEVIRVYEPHAIRAAMNAKERTLFHRAFGFNRDRNLGFLPTHYARQIRAGLRDGITKVLTTYINQLRVFNFGGGELGGPYVPWHQMMLTQSTAGFAAAARETGSYLTSLHVGPAIGVPGWMAGPAIGNLVTNGVRGQDGIFVMKRISKGIYDYQPNAWAGSQPWYVGYSQQMDQGMREAQMRIDGQINPSMTTWKTKPRALKCELLFAQ